MQNQYDLAVIGSGPAGQKAAINAAKLGRRVAMIERQQQLGGVCMTTGTIPSKALREAVMHLTGYSQRGVYGSSYSVKRGITMHDLLMRVEHIVARECEVVRIQMERNGVDVIGGRAVFIGPHLLCVEAGGVRREIVADKIVIACGTCPARPESVPFASGRVFDSDELLRLQSLPASMIVVGAGVIGVEYACMLQAVGVKITLIDARERMLEFLDREIGAALNHHMREAGVRIYPSEKVAAIETVAGGVCATLASGKQLAAETLLYTIGRQGATEELNLEAAGLSADDRGRLTVNEYFQTEVSHVYAVGDVVGFPSLASTSMEQGRLASSHACGQPTGPSLGVFPYGIYTIPEVSMVGPSEQELSQRGEAYCVGIARYREIARGQLMGDTSGVLKLIFSQDDHRLLGVHALGAGATELIHIGQAVMSFGGRVEYFVDTVFNYPTLAECYKVAALDGLNRARLIQDGRAKEPARPVNGETDLAEAAAFRLA